VHPVGFGYTEDVSSEQVADDPPMVRGQSAGVEKNLSETVSVGNSVEDYSDGRSAWVSRTVRASAEMWRRAA